MPPGAAGLHRFSSPIRLSQKMLKSWHGRGSCGGELMDMLDDDGVVKGDALDQYSVG